MIASRVFPRTGILGAGFVIFQIALVLSVALGKSSDPVSTALLAATAGLVLIFLALLSPKGLILAAPLALLLPGRVLTFYALEWFLMAGFASAVLHQASGRRPWRGPSTMEVIWFAYMAWAALGLTRAADTHSALQGISRILVTGLAFVSGYRVLGDRGARPLIRVIAVLTLALAVQLVGFVLVHGYSTQLLTSRVITLTDLGWGVSNYVAAVVSLTAACAITLFFFGSPAERTLGAVGVVAAVVVQVTTLSRGGAVALLLGLLLAGLLEARRRLLPVLIVIAGVGTAYLFSPLGAASLARLTSPLGMASIGARLLFFREAVSIWRAHWITGVGPDQIPYHTPIFVGPNPHNIFLKHLADLGVIGLALYVALLGLLLSTAIRGRLRARTREDRVVAMAMILTLGVALANAQYEPTLEGNIYGCLFWLLMGALSRRLEKATDAGTTASA